MLIDVVVPSAGESIAEVDIAEWRKAEGATVQRDDTLVVVETDKATMEIPAPESGRLAKILKKSGETAGVGEVIAKIESGQLESANGEPKEVRQAAPAAAKPAVDNADEAAPDTSDAAEAEKEAEQISGPSALQQTGEDERANAFPAEPEEPPAPEPEEIDPTEKLAAPSGQREHRPAAPFTAQTTTPEKRAQQAAATPEVESSPAPRRAREPAVRDGRQEEFVPLTALRRRIAQRLVQAQQTAALLTTFNEIDMSRVAELREQHRQAFEHKYKVKLGIMSFFVKAAVAALKAAPEINAELRGEQIVYRSYYDIGIAVGGGKGLVVPVLRDAEHQSFAQIEIAIADFARRAREARLNPEDLEGGTFTITNGGIYGSLLSTPIVNPPQTAILGMHAIQERPVARAGAVVIRPMMYVALTYDHRLVDGREAVSFLKHIKELVEEPTRMLFEI
jgi:2-oxoglutarate dehydrogenase E2 component (dihydrolipoamide succinyltransferase)